MIDTAMVFHHNCSKACRHCFCQPSKICDLFETKQLLNELENQGYKTKVMFTDQADWDVIEVIKKVGFDIVELKDEVDPDYIRELEAVNVTFGLSLHGHTAELHDMLCREGNFEKTMRALQQFSDLGLKNLRIYSVLHKKNYPYIDQLCEMLRHYNVDRIIFLRLIYSGNAKNLPEELFFDEEAYLEFYKRYFNVRQKFKGQFKVDLLAQHWEPKYSKIKALLLGLTKTISAKQRYFCQGGREKVAIHSKTKQIYPCCHMITENKLLLGHYDEKRGVVLENDLWLNDLIQKIGEPCKSCNLLHLCGGHCRGTAIADHLFFTGEYDIYAGHRLCPYALGISKFFDWEEFVTGLRRAVRKVSR